MRKYLEAFLGTRLTAMDNGDLQSLQVAGKHPPLGIVQGSQILRTRLAKDAGSERDEIATLIHGTDGGIAVDEEFAYN
jgi:hypothetical protein